MLTAEQRKTRRKVRKKQRRLLRKLERAATGIRRPTYASRKRAPLERAKNGDPIQAFYRSWDWKQLRYSFLKEHQCRCGCCGRTPADGIHIVVDHVKPIRFHWHLRLDKTNLQLLCNDCNMGKGSHDKTDWRTEEQDNFDMVLAAVVDPYSN